MLPALDEAVFATLAQELRSYPEALQFLADFDSMLPGRISRIGAALECGEGEEMTTALLSLHASAAMAGACELQHSTADALTTIRCSGVPLGYAHQLVLQLTDQAQHFTSSYRAFRHEAL
ncbi:hypothetical protein MN0502_31230 [Arthrobacter sp. MN05-02]|nr:hypothetical protein MN0502_31230 [Arthrobacter sp. MN05-02]